MLPLGGVPYVRSIQRVNPDPEPELFTPSTEGLVLSGTRPRRGQQSWRARLMACADGWALTDCAGLRLYFAHPGRHDSATRPAVGPVGRQSWWALTPMASSSTPCMSTRLLPALPSDRTSRHERRQRRRAASGRPERENAKLKNQRRADAPGGAGPGRQWQLVYFFQVAVELEHHIQERTCALEQSHGRAGSG